jgi:hypothetical protein
MRRVRYGHTGGPLSDAVAVGEALLTPAYDLPAGSTTVTGFQPHRIARERPELFTEGTAIESRANLGKVVLIP